MKLLLSVKEKLQTLFESKPLRYGFAGFITSLFIFGFYFIGKPIYFEYQDSFAAKEFRQYGVIGTYQRRFFNFKWKLKEMELVDRENEELNHKVANLEEELSQLNAKLVEKDASQLTQEVSEKLKSQTGSALARALSEIHYTPPVQLLPYQLYSIGLAYFRKQEFEQAAVIFDQLIHLKDDASYRRADVYLISGICWFKLKHFQLANDALLHAKEMSSEKPEIMKKALLWDALIAEALGEKLKTQAILTSLIARFPHSDEAMSINRLPLRKVASREHEPNRAVQSRIEKNAAEEAQHGKAIHHDVSDHGVKKDDKNLMPEHKEEEHD